MTTRTKSAAEYITARWFRPEPQHPSAKAHVPGKAAIRPLADGNKWRRRWIKCFHPQTEARIGGAAHQANVTSRSHKQTAAIPSKKNASGLKNIVVRTVKSARRRGSSVSHIRFWVGQKEDRQNNKHLKKWPTAGNKNARTVWIWERITLYTASA